MHHRHRKYLAIGYFYHFVPCNNWVDEAFSYIKPEKDTFVKKYKCTPNKSIDIKESNLNKKLQHFYGGELKFKISMGNFKNKEGDHEELYYLKIKECGEEELYSLKIKE